MVRILAIIAASAAALAAHGLSASAQDADMNETLYLDSYEDQDDEEVGPIQTAAPLRSGEFYVITVSGTFTAYPKSLWGDNPARKCGTPDAGPVTPSPGREPAPAGHDAEFIYGLPKRRFCPKLPRVYYGFTIDIGQGWFNFEPIGGQPADPNPGGAYQYLVQGRDVPVRMRIVDVQTRDNNGVLTINVRSAVRSECQGDAICENATQDQPPPPPPSDPFEEVPAESTKTLPSTRICISRRRFKIHILNPRRRPLRAVAVTLNGRGLKVHRARRSGRRYFVAVIDLRGRTRGKVRVGIVTKSRNGKIRRSRRVYRVCMGTRKPRRRA